MGYIVIIITVVFNLFTITTTIITTIITTTIIIVIISVGRLLALSFDWVGGKAIPSIQTVDVRWAWR